MDTITAPLTLNPRGAYLDPTDPGEPGYPGQKRQRQSITDLEGKILAKHVEGKTVLEIGTGLGVSTAYLATTAEKVYTIDTDPWVQANVYPRLKSEKIITLESLGDCPIVDAGFIDACHTTPDAIADTLKVMGKLRRPGIILYHDYVWQSVRDAINSMWHEYHVYHTPAGIAVVEVKE